ncbi:hypothetical protein CYLTODRAFT_38893 [Cylindrobasidium torrendii FP15055 ss-10]|uniref:Uncharacterized protein n=1 Tax=Cylindrobasidium torrendii FP15055 ss-10 TaxID=1314674 RepID=A0A0D7B7W2_9AGAR|nr:hypothetical protein CYLTODRAFT_38893 [Cylindrobasidium torrendii FP15055 ss-10]
MAASLVSASAFCRVQQRPHRLQLSSSESPTIETGVEILTMLMCKIRKNPACITLFEGARRDLEGMTSERAIMLRRTIRGALESASKILFFSLSSAVRCDANRPARFHSRRKAPKWTLEESNEAPMNEWRRCSKQIAVRGLVRLRKESSDAAANWLADNPKNNENVNCF